MIDFEDFHPLVTPLEYTLYDIFVEFTSVMENYESYDPSERRSTSFAIPDDISVLIDNVEVLVEILESVFDTEIEYEIEKRNKTRGFFYELNLENEDGRCKLVVWNFPHAFEELKGEHGNNVIISDVVKKDIEYFKERAGL